METPGTKTIDEVAAFLKYSPNNNIKSLAFMLHDGESPAGSEIWRPLLVLMRGNDQMNEAKLVSAVEGREFRPMQDEEIVQYFGSPAGLSGPGGTETGATRSRKRASAALRGEAGRFRCPDG